MGSALSNQNGRETRGFELAQLRGEPNYQRSFTSKCKGVQRSSSSCGQGSLRFRFVCYLLCEQCCSETAKKKRDAKKEEEEQKNGDEDNEDEDDDVIEVDPNADQPSTTAKEVNGEDEHDNEDDDDVNEVQEVSP